MNWWPQRYWVETPDGWGQADDLNEQQTLQLVIAKCRDIDEKGQQHE
jgi:hypothetical protein